MSLMAKKELWISELFKQRLCVPKDSLKSQMNKIKGDELADLRLVPKYSFYHWSNPIR